MSKWKNKDGKTVRRNQIASQFAWLSIEALKSPAYRALSLSGHRILARIQIEHAHNGGKENGNLIVMHENFHSYGIAFDCIAPGVREVCALGFARITQVGRAGNGEWRRPTKFSLTHLPTKDNPKPTEDWKRIKTFEEATAIARSARTEKQKATPRKRSTSRSRFWSTKTKLPLRDPGVLSTPEFGALSIFRVNIPSGSLPSTLLEWCLPIPNINPSDEADAAAWIDAWLGQVPAPTLSLAEIRSSLGYRQ